jgi:hypothetical protein
MIGLRRIVLLAALAVPALAALAAQDAAVPVPGIHIYQQRLADGRVVLTDRPVDGAQTQRTWQISREDPAEARQRSEQVRLEAQAVSERVQRRIDRQQTIADNADLARLRSSLAEARRDAELARDSADNAAVLVLPQAFGRAPHARSQRPGWRPRTGHPRPIRPQRDSR